MTVAQKRIRNGSRKASYTGGDHNFEDFSIVWLDEDKDRGKTEYELRRIINYLKLFHNGEQCVKYVQSVRTEKVFLILSDKFSKTVIPRIHDHSQLEHIYIYSRRRRSARESLNQTYAKVSGVFTDDGSLMMKLKEDHKVSSNNLCSTSLITWEKSMNNFDLNSSMVSWFPLLIEKLINIPQSDSIRSKLVCDCELEYIDNEFEQKSIEDFRHNYKSSEAVAWYRRDCFIYRLLNKAFRSEDIVTLFKFRFFIADMYHQLEKLRLHYLAQLPIDQKQWMLYRGQGINSEELDKIKANIGKLISINTYFLTTNNFQTAIESAWSNEQTPCVESIVFQIVINLSVTKSTKPFGVIDEDKDQQQILFSPCTIFQNESIEQRGSVWYVKLRLVNEKQIPEMNQITDILKRENDETVPLTSIGYFLWKIGKYDKGERIFRILLEELRSFDNDQVSNIYKDIGSLYYERGRYNEAFDYYEKSLKYAKKNPSPHTTHIATILNNMGWIYAHKKKYPEALKFYKEALQIRLDIIDPKPNDLADLATSYANIGCIYADMRLFSQALINLDKALDIRLKQLPDNHPDIGQSYNALGHVYFLQGYLKRALKTHHGALEINLASLPANHPDLLKTYDYIGAIHFAEHRYLLAIENYEKAIDIGRQCLAKDHPTFVQIYQSIAYVHKAMKDQSMTLKYFRKALDIEKHRSKLNHALLFEIYTHVGTTYEALGKNSMALNHYKIGLMHGFKMRTQNYTRINTVQNAIQRCVNRADQPATKNSKKK